MSVPVIDQEHPVLESQRIKVFVSFMLLNALHVLLNLVDFFLLFHFLLFHTPNIACVNKILVIIALLLIFLEL